MEVKKRTAKNQDFISDLPDLVLVHILSFLTTKEAVETSILSKRWWNLWAYVPCLRFDCKKIYRDVCFQHFVSAVMILRKTDHLDTFCLKWDINNMIFPYPILTAWLLHVLECNPRIIDVDCPGFCVADLPPSLFSCSSLVELHLTLLEYQNNSPRHISLPNLKNLYLSTEIISNENMEQIFSGCPSLEKLELYGSEIGGSVFVISSTVLKHLSLVNCTRVGKFHISTPSLLSLPLNGYFYGEIAMNNMPSLVKASLCFNSDAYLDAHFDLHFEDDSVDNCCDILGALSSVAELELLGQPLLATLGRTRKECPSFYNLKQLTLDGYFKGDSDGDNRDWGHIFTINSPNIERIIVIQSGATTRDARFRKLLTSSVMNHGR